MRVNLIAVSRPVIGSKDPRRLVEIAVKTSAGKVRKKGWAHYLFTERTDEELNRWLLESAEKFPSVLEHVVFTFMISDISRVTSHQLVRHRIASYTQESQRYSAISDPHMILEDVEHIRNCLNGNKDCTADEIRDVLEKYFVIPPGRFDPTFYVAALQTYAYLLLDGVPYEDARYVLPQAVKTRIMMTVNLRELLHIGCMRLRDEAQAEIREVVKQMFTEVEQKTGIPIWEMKNKYCK